MSQAEPMQPESPSTPKSDWVGFLPFVISGISFVPLCGVPFGILAVLYGLFTKKRYGKLVAAIGALGISLTVVLYGGLWYFGFVQRGGVYDDLRARLAENQLTTLVPALEFYKLQNGAYPNSLEELQASQKDGQPLLIVDPSTMVGSAATMKPFYYELSSDGSGYYLLGVGPDGEPYTSDDLLPNVELTNTGLQIDARSQP